MIDVRTLTQALFDGNAAEVLNAMTATPVVDDQRLGRLQGREAVVAWIENTADWLRGLHATSDEIATLQASHRHVHEVSLTITANGETVDLPYVLVADIADGKVTEMRTYHSTWPYTGAHVFRASPLTGREPEQVPAVFQWYIDQISVPNVAAVLDRFTQDGYVREPSGNRWKHQGMDGRAAFYGHLDHAPKATFDLLASAVEGHYIAVEYAFAYGDNERVGGICTMQLDGDRIAAIRITDDVGV